MDKSILIKGSIIMGLFLLIIGAAVGCSLITADSTEPTLSNGDDVYLTMDDFTITNAQLWEVMKNVDGLSYLTDYVDRILLEDEINAVTLEEIEKEVTYLTYLTYSEDIIAEIQADAEKNQEYLDAFDQNLIILGFDPTSADDLRAFTEVGIAKTKVARQYMLDATGDDIFAFSDEDLQDYYESVTYGDVCAIEIRFESETEANSVFDHFNLVPSFNLGIGLYTDTEIDIEDVASDGFELDVNTTQLTDEEVFDQFVLIYNYMNPWKTEITPGISQVDYCADMADMAVYNFDEMVNDRDGSEPYVSLATYMFQTLTLDPEDEDGINFSYSPQAFSDSASYVYKLTEEDIIAYEDLAADDLLELKNDILDLIVTSDNIEDIIDTIYEDIDFVIYDPYLALKYEYEYGVKFDNDGSKTLVAKIGDVEITADQLFTFMEEKVGAFYTIELAKIELLLTSDAYADVYGDDFDYMNSDNDTMVENRDELRTMKSTFAGNGYASYGFSSTDYTWEEFLYLAFSVKTEGEVIEQLFIMQDLQNQLIYPTVEYASAEAYILAQYEEYFSLNAEHLLLFIDFDNDFIPDDYDEYLEGLDAAGVLAYDAAKLAFDTLVFAKLDDDYTFAEIVEEYEDSLMNDPLNEWAVVKQYGFQIATEDLTVPDSDGTITSLDNTYSDDFDPAFAERLKIIYDAFVNLDNNTVDGIIEYMDTQIVESSFGIHLILATKGTTFEQFSAAYDPLADIDSVYSEGSENTEDLPNEVQIGIYNTIVYATIGGDSTLDLLPPDVYQSIDQLYGALFDAYFTQTGFSIVALNSMFDNNVEFTSDNTDNINSLQSILDVLYIINFPEEFVVVD